MTNLLQKVKFCDATQSKAEDAFLMGTRNGGHLLGQSLGVFQPGSPADFVVMDLNDLSLQPPGYFGKHIVYAAQPSAIQAAYVAGDCIMQQGQLLKVSEASIVQRIQDTMKQLLD